MTGQPEPARDAKPPALWIGALVPPDPGSNTKHLVLVTHRGGGWYDAACMGQSEPCKAGECHHSAGMRFAGHKRMIRQVPR